MILGIICLFFRESLALFVPRPNVLGIFFSLAFPGQMSSLLLILHHSIANTNEGKKIILLRYDMLQFHNHYLGAVLDITLLSFVWLT